MPYINHRINRDDGPFQSELLFDPKTKQYVLVQYEDEPYLEDEERAVHLHWYADASFEVLTDMNHMDASHFLSLRERLYEFVRIVKDEEIIQLLLDISSDESKCERRIRQETLVFAKTYESEMITKDELVDAGEYAIMCAREEYQENQSLRYRFYKNSVRRELVGAVKSAHRKNKDSFRKRMEKIREAIKKKSERVNEMDFHAFHQHVSQTLSETFEQVEKWFDKPKEVRSYKPENGGWTINQVLEHIALTNHYLLILIDKAKEKALKREVAKVREHVYDEESLRKLGEIGQHGSFSWTRPEHMEPTGNMSLEQVRETVNGQVEKCREVLELLKDGRGVDVKTTMSVNGLGKIDVYQYIYFWTLHAKRHLTQMEKAEREYGEKNQ